jgi:Amt family ammonium transporter
MLHMTKVFADQISASAYLTDIFYILAVVFAFLIVGALMLIDGGLIARKHMTDAMAQKMISAFIAALCCSITAFPLWISQFYNAFQVPHPVRQAFADWWLFGSRMRTYGQNIDSAIAPGVEVSQIFVTFFFAYAAILGAYIHSIGLGRMKPVVCFILSACAGGIMMPILADLTWGPASPLTNNGLHDFFGAYAIYIPVAIWGTILTWRLGPRLASSNSFDAPMVTLGVFLLMLAIPCVALGCGFLEPGNGYFGISYATSGVGIVLINIFFAYGGGAISGAIIAYRQHKAVYIFLGPLSGFVCCSALLDIAAPWQCLLVAMCGPWLLMAGKEALKKLNIDDQKVVPLTGLPALLSVLMVGVIGAGLPTGGVPGTTGEYALQHAHISLSMQLLGLLIVIAFSASLGLALIFLLEKTIGLRVPQQVEQDGLDEWYWNEWRKSRRMRVSPMQLPDYRGPEPAVSRLETGRANRHPQSAISK